MKTYIQSYCRIQDGVILRDGEVVYEHIGETADLDAFLTAAYQQAGLSYSKFFKMDPLCRLAILAAEGLPGSGSGAFETADPVQRAIVLGNRTSSILSDRRHQASLDCPSPAVFVYTLPSIMIGELSIRHNIQGENSLFVTESFDPETLAAYADDLFADGLCSACLCGWIDASPESYEALLYLVDTTPTAVSRPHTPDEIRAIYEEHQPYFYS